MEKTIKEKIENIFIKEFPYLKPTLFNFQMDRSQFENWDSLTHLRLVSEIESQFKINFDMDEIVDINKPEDFITLVKKKLK